MDDGQDELAARVEARHSADRVLDGGALRALAHPLRVRMYDILSTYGPQTASSLAERLGESSGSTSYHLRALAKHDLIREVPDKGTGRERWWERPDGGVSFGDPETITSPAGRAASQVVMSEFLRNRNDQLLAFVGRGLDQLDEAWRDSSLISTATTSLTPEQARDLTIKIQALVDETVDAYRHQTGDNVRRVSIRADVFPLPDLADSP